jgi:hypothetical protein
MGFERTIGPHRQGAPTIVGVGEPVLPSGERSGSSGNEPEPRNKTPRLGSMATPLLRASATASPSPPPTRPPSAWKRPLLVAGLAPARAPIAAVQRPASSRPPPPIALPARTSSPPNDRLYMRSLALAAGVGVVFLVALISLAVRASASRTTPASALTANAPTPSVAAWTLDDAPGLSASASPVVQAEATDAPPRPAAAAAPRASTTASTTSGKTPTATPPMATSNPASTSPIQRTR